MANQFLKATFRGFLNDFIGGKNPKALKGLESAST
jgi:hypothetical protein